MNNRKRISHLLVALLLLPAYIYAQSPDEISKFLESKVNHKFQYLDNGAFSQISGMQLIEALVEQNFDNNGSGGNATIYYLQKNGEELKKIPSPEQLINMPEFYQSIKNSFTLKTPDDGLVLQTALNVISQEKSNEGFFKVGNKWYFIRSEFFGRYYIAQTDTDGKITQIKKTKGIETEIPADVYFRGEIKTYPNTNVPEIDKNTQKKLTEFLAANFESRFEVQEATSDIFSQISAAKLFNASYIVVEKQDKKIRIHLSRPCNYIQRKRNKCRKNLGNQPVFGKHYARVSVKKRSRGFNISEFPEPNGRKNRWCTLL